MAKQNLPQHIAIILDGNRRWAREKGMPAVRGHEYGAKTLDKIVEHCLKVGIKHLTVYVFSTENWKRTKFEVNALMVLLEKYLKDKGSEMAEQGIRLTLFGEKSRLPKTVQGELNKILKQTKSNKKLHLNLALNYGGRSEITEAVKKINSKKISSSKITEKLIADNLYSVGQPDPDLVIRTGGEMRLSNFLLWQVAYSELYFIKKYWPAFTPRDLDRAIEEWQRRQRRFGK